MGTRYFELSDDKSSKFWEISTQAREITTRWGRIGAAGQSKTKTFQTVEETLKDASKLIAAKIKKGYIELSTDVANAATSSNALQSPITLAESDGVATHSKSWERVFVRDVKAESPECIGQAMNYSRSPFESDSGSGGSGPPHLLPENNQKCAVRERVGSLFRTRDDPTRLVNDRKRLPTLCASTFAH